MVSADSSIARKRGLVLGCGGTLGRAWSIAALIELSRAMAWDPRDAAVIVGTSAGAELACLLGSGVSAQALLDAEVGAREADAFLARHFASPPAPFPPLPSLRPASLKLGARVFKKPSLVHLSGLLPEGTGDSRFLAALVDSRIGEAEWAPHPATWLVAVDVDSGERVAFGSRGAPRARMRDALRASLAIPTWFPPVAIGGRRYIDGGVASPTSADLALPLRLDEIVVIAPMSSRDLDPARGLARVERVARDAMRRTLDREVAQLRRAGTRVVLIEPSQEDLNVMGPNFMDRSRRLRVVESSLRSCRRTVESALATARRVPAVA